MKKRDYLKKVKLQMRSQRIVLIGCAAVILGVQLAFLSGAMPSWLRYLPAGLSVLCIAVALVLNVRSSRAVAMTDNTLEAIIHLGGAVLVEDEGKTVSGRIDPQLLHDLREMVKEFLNLGSTQEIIRTQTNLVALQNQINPHFLYNTLEVIRSEAILEGAHNAPDMIETLSRVFRYGISNKEDLVTLEDELKNVKDYFRIQQYRFLDRYVLRFENPQQIDCEAVLVPKLTLQPLVENAILHAFQHKSGPGTITIRLDMTERKLKINVSDDGCGLKPEVLQELRRKLRSEVHGAYQGLGRDTTGIALENINKRVKLFFGDEYGLTVFSLPSAGTDVVVTVPVESR